jgi:predicted O-linked N-acetylglucosamine transferase (SPINDLY family)
LYRELQHYELAFADYELALSIKPNYEYLKGVHFATKMNICDWRDLDDEWKDICVDIELSKKVIAPFMVLPISDSIDLHRKVAELWVGEKHPSHLAHQLRQKKDKYSKIKVGYFSADYHEHATMYLMAQLFEMHDKSKFEIIGFSFGPDKQDAMRQRAVAAFSQFYDVRDKTDQEIAQFSRDLGLDIAVDLKGVTQDARLGIFSFRAAPIQVSYLGYPGTLGADYIDYLIADKTLIPTQSQQHYSEKIVYLPDSYQVNDRHRVIASTQFTRQELGLPEDAFVFCCFNNNFKITPDVFDSWVRILKAVDTSVLWLFQDNSIAAMNLHKEAALRGIDPARLIFATRMELPEHLARHKAADLFLDTLPYNAHTTASDALWAGLPVLTCMGESFAGRVAASLLNAIGLPELVTETRTDYEAQAIELAKNPAKLKKIKEKLEHNRLTTPLFDTARFTKNIEAAYSQMFERYQADLMPANIEVL